MLYSDYKTKIIKLSNRLKKARSVFLICLMVVIIVFAAMLVFEFFIGSFVSDVLCDDITYGDVPNYHAEAFLCSVNYEFKLDNGDWTQAIPKVAGKYFVRGFSENNLGIRRYTDERAFTISPKHITISPQSLSWQFGDSTPYTDTDILCDGLVFDDIVEGLTFSTSSEIPGEVSVSVNTERITIKSGDIDVTSSYIVSTDSNTATIIRPQLKIATDNAEKEYDGQSLSQKTFSILQGRISKNHSLKVDFFNAIPDVGGISNDIKVTIIDSNDNDVTEFYDIFVNCGKLVINKRKLTISSGSAEKEYDGTPLKKEEYEITSGSLAPNETAQLEFVSMTDAGEQENGLTVKIYDQNGKETTQNYDLTCEYGKLVVNKRKLTISSGSAEKEYDGTLFDNNYMIVSGSIADSQTLNVTFKYAPIDVGNYLNEFIVVILDRSGKDVTDQYEIVSEFGIIKIAQAVLKITSNALTETVEDIPIVPDKYTIVHGTIFGEDVLEVTFSSSYVDVGEYDIVFTAAVFRYEENKKVDITANYKIYYSYGKLIINP